MTMVLCDFSLSLSLCVYCVQQKKYREEAKNTMSHYVPVLDTPELMRVRENQKNFSTVSRTLLEPSVLESSVWNQGPGSRSQVHHHPCQSVAARWLSVCLRCLVFKVLLTILYIHLQYMFIVSL